MAKRTAFGELLRSCPQSAHRASRHLPLEAESCLVAWRPRDSREVILLFPREQQLLQQWGKSGQQPAFVLAPFVPSLKDPIVWLPLQDAMSVSLEADCWATHQPYALRESLPPSSPQQKAAYMQRFTLLHQRLMAGELQKIVLSRARQIRLEKSLDPLALFLTAVEAYPQADVCLVQLSPGDCWLSASPEALLESRQEEICTYAIAATHQSKREWTQKELDEQELVCAHIRHCLQQQAISYREEERGILEVEAGLEHLCSRFSFCPSPEANPLELISALHPTPAVGGSPQETALRVLAQEEGTERCYYGGFFGIFVKEWLLDLRVNIRCLHLQGELCTLYAGGGLLPHSQPQEEWAETEAKLQTMGRLIPIPQKES